MGRMTSFLAPLTLDQRVNVSCVDLSVMADEMESPAAKVVKRVFGDTKHRRNNAYPQLLDKVSCELAAGEVTLILSPESGGEQTFLRLVADLPHPSLHVTGKLLFNGQPSCQQVAAALTDEGLVGAPCIGGLVHQEVVACQGPEGAVAIADQLLEATGLTEHKFEALGVTDDSIKSEGLAHLRKRISLARVLARRPALLLVHEPLLGSQPTQAKSMMHLLRQLADGGRTVVIGTEEGMDGDAFDQVDTVLVLSKGRTMYYGKADQAATWFSAQGHQKPDGMSVPDFLVNLADGAFTDDAEAGELGRAESVEMATAYLREYPQGFQGGAVPEMTDDDEDGATANETMEAPLQDFMKDPR